MHPTWKPRLQKHCFNTQKSLKKRTRAIGHFGFHVLTLFPKRGSFLLYYFSTGLVSNFKGSKDKLVKYELYLAVIRNIYVKEVLRISLPINVFQLISILITFLYTCARQDLYQDSMSGHNLIYMLKKDQSMWIISLMYQRVKMYSVFSGATLQMSRQYCTCTSISPQSSNLFGHNIMNYSLILSHLKFFLIQVEYCFWILFAQSMIFNAPFILQSLFVPQNPKLIVINPVFEGGSSSMPHQVLVVIACILII